ncbi:MAG TPA: hypothetical protein VGP72_31245 [Planctomycetota bacterium]|jgi:hypothetical protein
METLERSVLILKPTKKFLNWVRELDDANSGVTLEDLHSKQTVYLIPPYDDEQEAVEYLWDYCPVVFRHQLGRWCKDAKLFPKDLSWNTFMQWFEIELQPKVVDVNDDAEACDRLGRDG